MFLGDISITWCQRQQPLKYAYSNLPEAPECSVALAMTTIEKSNSSLLDYIISVWQKTTLKMDIVCSLKHWHLPAILHAITTIRHNKNRSLPRISELLMQKSYSHRE
jgi:hypothetical protein